MKILTSAIYLFGCLFLFSTFAGSSPMEEVVLVLSFEATVPTGQKEELENVFRTEERINK